jgi:hypothetical protein
VHGPLEQEREDRGTDVEPGAPAASALTSGPAGTERSAGAELAWAEGEAEPETATHAPAVETFSV